jgi:hypothetical protein
VSSIHVSTAQPGRTSTVSLVLVQTLVDHRLAQLPADVSEPLPVISLQATHSRCRTWERWHEAGNQAVRLSALLGGLSQHALPSIGQLEQPSRDA